MDKLVFLRTGAIKLPPGFRFNPTDEELVVHYLCGKASSTPLPASIIPEIDLAKRDPWDLPGVEGREMYFFSLREAKYPNSGRPNRTASSGYWKATGRDKAIVDTRRNEIVGMKKILVFYQGKPGLGSRTDWIMHEYRLSGVQDSKFTSQDWVLCRIFKKMRATKMEEIQTLCEGSRFINFFPQKYVANSPSSDSSCVTDASHGSSGWEESSCDSIP